MRRRGLETLSGFDGGGDAVARRGEGALPGRVIPAGRVIEEVEVQDQPGAARPGTNTPPPYCRIHQTSSVPPTGAGSSAWPISVSGVRPSWSVGRASSAG